MSVVDGREIYLQKMIEASKNTLHPFDRMTKKRGFATEIYLDNRGDESYGLLPTPENWIDMIRNEHIQCYISPYHDKDVDPNGKAKKPHYHVVFTFAGPTTVKQFNDIRHQIGGVGIQPLTSIRQYLRYLCHLDNPEKYQYPISDVQCLGLNDYEDLIEQTYNRKKCISEMTYWIDENHVRSFSYLFRFCRQFNEEWYNCLLDNTMIIKEYLKGLEYERKIERQEV